MLDPVFSLTPIAPATVASPGLTPQEATAWAALPQPLARYTRQGLSREWRGEKKGEIQAEIARGMLRAWSEAPAQWKAAITALAASPSDFAAWVRSTYKKIPARRDGEWLIPREQMERERDRRSNLSGPLMIGGGTHCSTNLLNVVIEAGYLPHYAAWLETGLLTPDVDVLDRLGKRHGQPESWLDRERRLRIEWVRSLSPGHLAEAPDSSSSPTKVIVNQTKKRGIS